MSLDLDENYSASTKLSTWWKQVKSNFAKLNSDKADITRYASIGQAGLIKLHHGTNNGVDTNKSGIIVSEKDGTAYIATKTNGGILRDGAGGLYVDTATVDEIINGGKDYKYKPVTPAVFKAGVENIVGAASALTTDSKDSCVSAINELKTDADKKSDELGNVSTLPSLPDSKKSKLAQTPQNLASAISLVAKYSESDGGTVSIIDPDDFKFVYLSGQTYATMTMKTTIALDHGCYIFTSNGYAVNGNITYSIRSISITNRSGETATLTYDFETGSTYLIQLTTDNSKVICKLTNTEEYSTTPVQTGAWVDGTPVWRVALPYVQMQAGSRHLIVDDENYNIKIGLESILEDYVEDVEATELLNVNINVRSEYRTDIQAPDDVVMGTIYFARKNEKYYKDYITDGNGYWGGYIDFISARNNLK